MLCSLVNMVVRRMLPIAICSSFASCTIYLPTSLENAFFHTSKTSFIIFLLTIQLT